LLPPFDLGLIALLNKFELDKILIPLIKVWILLISLVLDVLIFAYLDLDLLDSLVNFFVSHGGYLLLHGLEFFVDVLFLFDTVLDHLLLSHQVLVFFLQFFLLLYSLLAEVHL
jgi:hypothetical protein